MSTPKKNRRWCPLCHKLKVVRTFWNPATADAPETKLGFTCMHCRAYWRRLDELDPKSAERNKYKLLTVRKRVRVVA